MTISRNLSILAEGVSSSGVLGAANGGTGQSAALTQYGVVYGSSSTAMAITAAGTTGQVLVATTSGAPSWGAVPSTAAVTSISFGTTGLTPSTATTGVVTVAGTLAVANGGTGVTTSTGTSVRLKVRCLRLLPLRLQRWKLPFSKETRRYGPDNYQLGP